MSNPFKYSDAESPPGMPKELVKVIVESNQQVFAVHLGHPNKSEDVHYVSIGAFLPRVGEQLKIDESGRAYRVTAVHHVISEAKFGTNEAYITRAHIMCAPLDMKEFTNWDGQKVLINPSDVQSVESIAETFVSGGPPPKMGTLIRMKSKEKHFVKELQEEVKKILGMS